MSQVDSVCPARREVVRLFGMRLEALQELSDSLHFPRYAAMQMAEWLYHRKVASTDDMLNLSKVRRAQLQEVAEVGVAAPADVQVSSDGTRKYLFPASPGGFVETVFIPDGERATACISSQVGCRMGCAFCMTGRQRFTGNLSSGDILNQLRSLPEYEALTNVVYMGMGEPFDNLDAVLESIEVLTAPWGFGMAARRITVSTAGVIPGMEEFLRRTRCHLAVSLHNPFDNERAAMMPVQHKYPISEVVRTLRRYDFSDYRRLSFEYIVFNGLNDTPRHADALAALLKGLPCRINLIRFHAIEGSAFRGAPEERMLDFQRRLQSHGLQVTIRHSRGEDIMAACGMLSTLKNNVQ
ncbi:MAG: 23S rRNA (adenine(2503)-C(2))-methyltransferase RlmN [Bacteroidales bacterium]|nr:23S rRNA (adenine(2503)-C(2))-methyltransferase RlmN [Bacteroidales bacterium]